jgi:hypothetical protein
MLINEETEEYETGDDADPNSDEEDDDMLYGDASPLPTIVCLLKVLSVSLDSAEQWCNLFQTKAVFGPIKACKVIIDGGSCRNLASEELCTKLKHCSTLPFEKGRTPMLSATLWITDSTIVQNIVIIAIVSKLQRKSSYIGLQPYEYTAENIVAMSLRLHHVP